MTDIRIVLADDHAVMRAGLRALLEAEPGLRVVGEAGDGYECVDVVAATAPDVVILDITMPRCNGFEALSALHERAPETHVLVLTMHDDVQYLRRVIESGGSGFVLKQSAGDELITAIRAVAGGGVYVSQQHALALVAAERAEPEPGGDGSTGRYAALSDREREIFTLVAQGHTNGEIADTLYLSVKTVETYRARLMRKLGVSTRAALVRLALELDVLK